MIFSQYLKEELEEGDSFDDLTSEGGSESTEGENSTGKGVPRPKAPGKNDGTKTKEGESIPEQAPGNPRSKITGQIGYAKSLLTQEINEETISKLTKSLDTINELVRSLEV